MDKPVDGAEALAREGLARELPQQDWDRLRTSILSGSTAFHGDPVSWVVEAAIRAMLAHSAALVAENERLRKALGRCAEIVDRNLYRQDEKVEDVPRIARTALETRNG